MTFRCSKFIHRLSLAMVFKNKLKFATTQICLNYLSCATSKLPNSNFLLDLYCQRSRPVRVVSESIRLLARQAENSTSGRGSFWELSLLGSWFSRSGMFRNAPKCFGVFRNVHGVVPENVRICGFKRNSSNLDSAPKMRDSVLLNSWDSFLVTLPSISSETCAI